MTMPRFILLFACLCVLHSQAIAVSPAILPDGSDEEFVGPFPSWRNIKTAYGAVGDGVADDTAAINAALLDLRLARNNGWSVLYLPAGTYRVTSTLVNTQRIDHNDYLGFSIIGEDPATTKIVYDGPVGGDLWELDGWYCKVSRLTLDGAGKAQNLLLRNGGFSTACEVSDIWFKDAEVGLRLGGGQVGGQAEHAVLRCHFTRLDQGLVTSNFNSMDIWVWWSLFEDCGKAVFNQAGNYHVYNSVFLRSTEQDIASNNLMSFSFVGNTSVGSKTFLDWRGGHTWGSPALVMGNRIYQPTSGVAMHTGNGGPWVLVDNVVGAAGDNSTQLNLTARDNLLVGNRLTSTAPVARGGRTRDVGTTRHDAAELSTPSQIFLPPTPPRRSRPIFEVAAGTGDDAAAFQAAISAAVASPDPRPVIHLAQGTWRLNRTVTIPAGRALRIVGDGGAEHGTRLVWGGAAGSPGPVLLLRGPSRADLRDFFVVGNGYETNVDGLVIEEPDLPGGRIYANQLAPNSASISDRAQHSLLVDGVEQADVTILCGQGFSNGVNGLTVYGGPEREAGRTAAGQVSLLTGANAQSLNNFLVEKGGRALVTSFYIETQGADVTQALKLDDAGSLTIAAVRFSYTANLTQPSLLIDGFRGDLAFVANFFYGVTSPDNCPSQWLLLKGTGAGLSALVAGNMFWGNFPQPGGAPINSGFVWRDQTAPTADAAFLLNNLNGNPAALSSGDGFDYLENVYRSESSAAPADAFVSDRLKLLREARMEAPSPRNPVVTDLRLHRIFAETRSGRSAIVIRRTPTAVQSSLSVSLASPLNLARTPVGASVRLQAVPVAAGSNIAKVEFYDGAELLGSTSAAPWELTRAFLATGVHALTAVATDQSGKIASSPLARLQVVASGESLHAPFAPAAATPTFSLPSGGYEGAQTVSIASVSAGATIRYTTDGSSPTRTRGSVYSGPITLATSSVLRAVAFTDSLVQSEEAFSSYTIYAAASSYRLFPDLTTANQQTDGVGYELGLRFTVTSAGQITALRYYRAASETGSHTGNLWGPDGQLLATVAFTPDNDAPGSGWREQPLPTPVVLTPGQIYVASVACNVSYPFIYDGLSLPVYSGPLVAIGGSNGVFGAVGSRPTQSFRETNYLRDVVFVPAAGSTSAPTIVTPPVGQSVTVGASVTLTVVVDGQPAPTLRWRKDGVELSGATSASLVLPAAQLSDAGVYDVVATNSAGTVTSASATLVVNSLLVSPQVTLAPQSQTVNAGQNLTLAGAANGVPAPAYTWLKDGAVIPGATAAVLELSNIQSADAGAYTFVATNSVGSVNSAAAIVAVRTSPVFITMPQPRTVDAGANVTFTVVVAGTPPPTLQWYKDETVLAGQTATTLVLSQVQPTDAGMYTVKGTNPAGSATSTAARLEVVVPPTLIAPVFTLQPVGLVVKPGSSVSLQASATGTPSPTYQWWRNGYPVVGATSGNLTFPKLQIADLGDYRLTATNTVGVAESQVATLGFNQTLFPDTRPTTITGNDFEYELGMRFSSTVPGTVTALRAWRLAAGPTVYTMRLWDAQGRLLATASRAAPPTAGWFEIQLTTPIEIEANSAYTVSYEISAGVSFPSRHSGLSSPYVNGFLVAPTDGGVFATVKGVYPTQTYLSSNYWADVRFSPSLSALAALPADRGYWKFDENSGSRVGDSSSAGNAGTLANTTWVAGSRGRALSFNGTSSRITVPDHPSLDLRERFYADFALQLTSSLAPTQQTILCKTKGSAAADGYALRLMPTGCLGLFWNGQWHESNPLTWTSGTWYRVVVWYDGTIVRFIRDGVSVGEIALPTVLTPATDGVLYFGRSSSTAGWLKARLDDFQLSDSP